MPSFSTSYCRPLAVVLTPARALFFARKASPSVLFFSPITFCFASCCDCTCFWNSCIVDCISASVSIPFAPARPSRNPLTMRSELALTSFCLSVRPRLKPIT